MKSFLRSIFVVLVFVTSGSLAWAAPRADDVIESYTARLSQRDHHASDGYDLTEAADILRQDRANYHKYGKADQQDESDEYFTSAEHREQMAAMLGRGDTERSVLKAIVSGTPLVQVTLYRNSETGKLYLSVGLAD